MSGLRLNPDCGSAQRLKLRRYLRGNFLAAVEGLFFAVFFGRLGKRDGRLIERLIR